MIITPAGQPLMPCRCLSKWVQVIDEMKSVLKKSLCGAFVFSFLLNLAGAQQKVHFAADKELLKTIDTNFEIADTQYKLLMHNTPEGRFPKTYHKGIDSLETSGPGWWCSGFFPGTLINIFSVTKDTVLLKDADLKLTQLASEQYNKTTHDLGFMMYCSFGTAYKMEPEPAFMQILINSAKSLATRFSPVTGCIRSWDSKKSDYIVIIDNMMNLELLCWATKETGDPLFYDIAVSHANTTMKNHFRPDYSSYHVVDYNPETGTVQQKRTAQGYSDESAWARGQAWGLYGYTMMYRETHDKKYLDQANHIAGFILNNPHLPPDKIPYWDYDTPDIPHALRDASAAAVMASALLELCDYVPADFATKYFRVAETILKTLSKSEYRASAGANGGFLLKHSVGNMPQHTEIDVPLTYADYYFTEAMIRYRHLVSGVKED